MRALTDAVAAADALAAVGVNGGVDVHLACFGAGVAADALALIEMHAVQRDLVEEAVDRAKRADIFAEWSVDDEACDEDQAEDNELQIEQLTELSCDLLVSCSEPDSCDGAGRADVLAEERRELEAEGQERHKKNKHHVLEVTQVFVELELVFLEERDLVEEVLQEAERA